MIISRTPFRVSFFGGGTDYPAWYREHGGAVLATTIDKYCYISVRKLPPFFDHRFRIVYSIVENVKEIREINHPAVRAVLEQLKVDEGVEIHHDGDLPARLGLGSSSSFTVGLLSAMHALVGRYTSKDALANEAIHVEQSLLCEPVGVQDQISAAFGGFNHNSFRRGLGARLTAVENPVWAGLIAMFVRRKGFSVQIVDAEAEKLTPQAAASRVIALKPRLVTVVVYDHQPSASTQNMTGASAMVTTIKNLAPDTKVMMLGGHVAALPARTLAEEACDFVTKDEGLYGAVELLAALRASGDPDLSKIRGLVYRKDGGVASNTAAPLVTDAEHEMPGIAWDLLPMTKYRAHNWHCFGELQRQPYAAIYTTLGCPYHCSFCCIQAPFKGGEKMLGLKESVNSYRYWSPTRVIEEIDLLVNTYDVRNIKVADEMFVLNQRHVLGICDLIIERGYDLNIWAYARVDTVKDGMLDKLKRAGFTWLALGIEAANARIFVAGGQTPVGHALLRSLIAAGFSPVGHGEEEPDLADRRSVDLFFD